MSPCAFVYLVGLEEFTSGRNDTKHIKAYYWLLLKRSGSVSAPIGCGPWQPAQISDAVAGMESQHAAASLSAKRPATGKPGHRAQQAD